MIEMPRRSVTRFFIPLIDVLTLLFCIYLLMPIVQTPDDAAAAARGAKAAARLTAAEHRELELLRRLNAELNDRVHRLRDTLHLAPPQRLAVALLQTGEKGKLFYPDPKQAGQKLEITAKNVQEFTRMQRQNAGERELYFLVVTPRIGADVPTYPLRSQLEEYDRWFTEVAHSHIYYPLAAAVP